MANINKFVTQESMGSSVQTLDGKITTNTNNIATLNTTVSGHTTSINTISTKVDTLNPLESEYDSTTNKLTLSEGIEGGLAEQVAENTEAISTLNDDLADKLDKPTDAPVVGKVLKVKTVNADGTFTCEWANGGGGGGATDVQINGTSITEDGVANIPLCSYDIPGVAQIAYNYGLSVNSGKISIEVPSVSNINNRERYTKAVTLNKLDYAVKSAMCDGVGASWTDAEKIASRARQGIVTLTQEEYDLIESPNESTFYATTNDTEIENIYYGGKRFSVGGMDKYEKILDKTITEDSEEINEVFAHNYRKITGYIIQPSTPETTVKYFTPHIFSSNGIVETASAGQSKLVKYLKPTTSMPNIMFDYEMSENIVKGNYAITNDKISKSPTPVPTNSLIVIKEQMNTYIFDKGFGGFATSAFLKDTRIIIYGVRA